MLEPTCSFHVNILYFGELHYPFKKHPDQPFPPDWLRQVLLRFAEQFARCFIGAEPLLNRQYGVGCQRNFYVRNLSFEIRVLAAD